MAVTTRSYEYDPEVVPDVLDHGIDGKAFLTRVRDGTVTTPPMLVTVNARMTVVEDGYVELEAITDGSIANTMGTGHGGFLATLLDTSLSCAVHATLSGGELYTTTDLHVRMTGRVHLDGQRVKATGKVVHRGRSTATADGDVFDIDTGKRLAHGTASCMILPKPKPG